VFSKVLRSGQYVFDQQASDLWTTERTTPLDQRSDQKDLLVWCFRPNQKKFATPLVCFAKRSSLGLASFASRRSGQDSGREWWLLDGCAYGPLRPSPLALKHQKTERKQVSKTSEPPKGSLSNCRPTRLRTLLVPLWFLHK